MSTITTSVGSLAASRLASSPPDGCWGSLFSSTAEILSRSARENLCSFSLLNSSLTKSGMTHVSCPASPHLPRPTCWINPHSTGRVFPPQGYCWRTLSVCSLSTQWRGLGQESSGGALQRPPPFGFASSIRKDGEPVIVCATSESSAIAHHWLQGQPLRLDHRAAGPLQSCRHLALLRRR